MQRRLPSLVVPRRFLLGDTTMAQQACKRFWEGTVGIAIRPRQKRGGGYFWTFSFVRAFRRSRDSEWEYAQHYGQKHAKAVGTVMTKAFQFMEQTDPARFVESAMAQYAANPEPMQGQDTEATLDGASFPSAARVAA